MCEEKGLTICATVTEILSWDNSSLYTGDLKFIHQVLNKLISSVLNLVSSEYELAFLLGKISTVRKQEVLLSFIIFSLGTPR